jgi:NMD protein affecting ribosome stability and mRNA decay
MRGKRSRTHQAASLPRTDRRIEEHESDTYGLKGKLPDPTACTSCGAMYRNGRWIWGAPPADANPTLCPACRRIQDDYPAGLVLVEGEFARSHREEIRGLARNLEEREKQEHPLKRIMRYTEPEDGPLEITTTDAHLARGIGEALHHAYQGELDYQYTDAENLLRVHWRR